MDFWLLWENHEAWQQRPASQQVAGAEQLLPLGEPLCQTPISVLSLHSCEGDRCLGVSRPLVDFDSPLLFVRKDVSKYLQSFQEDPSLRKKRLYIAAQ